MRKRFFIQLFCATIFIHYSSSVLADSGIRFTEDKGQWPDQVHYAGDLPAGKVFFEKNLLRYNFYNPHRFYRQDHEGHIDYSSRPEDCSDEILSHSYLVEFLGANERVSLTSGSPSTPTRYNYYVGSEERWASNVREFNHVRYNELYQGIDLMYKKYGETVRYDFIVKEGGDPSQIAMSYTGLTDMLLTQKGLNLVTSVSEVIESNPVTYQMIDGVRAEVESRFRLSGTIISFDFPSGYNECHDLIIDPTLIFSTYSGSTSDNWGNSATFDEDGNLYSGGITNHYSGGNFPATPGAFQTNTQGFWDVAILKYDSAGSNVLYATYLGGSRTELPQSMVVNDVGDLFVLGITSSRNFPVRGGFQTLHAGGRTISPFGGDPSNPQDNGVHFTSGTDLFISRLNKDGNALIASTYLGGSNNDGVGAFGDALVYNYGDQSRGDIALDNNGDVLIASRTNSPNFPLRSPLQLRYGGGGSDGIFAKISEDLSTLIGSSFFGGRGDDVIYSVKTDPDNNIILAGGTNSDNLGDIDGFFSDGYQGRVDGWLAKLDDNASGLRGGVYIGTNDYDQTYFAGVDGAGAIYVYGQSVLGLSTEGDAYSIGDGQFIRKYNAELTDVIFSGNFGSLNGTTDISPTAFLVNECDNLYVSGWGGETNYVGNTRSMAVTQSAFQRSTSGNDFYLASFSGDGKRLLYATYLGGGVSRTHVDGGTSRFDKNGIVYHAVCAGCANNPTGTSLSDFPTTIGAHSRSNRSQNCNNAAFKFDLSILQAIVRTNTPDLNNPDVRQICIGDELVLENLTVGGERYEWDLGDGTTAMLDEKSSITHMYDKAGFYNIDLGAIDETTCIGVDRASTTIEVIDVQFNVSDDISICEGDQITLRATSNVAFEWFNEDDTFSSTESLINVSPDKDTKYYVRFFKGECEKLDSVLVTVIPGVVFDLRVVKNHDCFSRPSVEFINDTKNDEGVEYLWDLGDGTTTSERNFTHNYNSDGEYVAKMTANRDFCEYEDQRAVRAFTVRVPNVITPYDDSQSAEKFNDTFVVESGTPVDLRVFNRWGKLIFEMDEYDDSWDGAGQSAGVYYYEATIVNDVVCKGWVQVIR